MEPEPGEAVFFHGHPSWRSMIAFYLRGLVIAVLAGVIAGFVTEIAAGHLQLGWVIAAVLAWSVVVVVMGLLRRLRTTYTVTNQRLTIEVGLLSRALHHTRLARVQNVSSSQTLLQRLLRVGTVDFDTAGEAGFDFSFRGVANPREIVRTVDRALREPRHADPGL
jgi:uncharacterized membrane protein YdbT with pleckstrin-like domain